MVHQGLLMKLHYTRLTGGYNGSSVANYCVPQTVWKGKRFHTIGRQIINGEGRTYAVVIAKTAFS